MHILILSVGLPVATGCLSPTTTRLPTVGYGPPTVAKRSYERHDPFADPALGPDTMSRPRGFVQPRTAPRKILEDALLRGLPNEAIPPGPAPPAATSQYPQAVRF